MKKLIYITMFTVFAFALPDTVTAQTFDQPDASPLDIAMYRTPDKRALIRVIYSRPQVNDRKIFGELVPFGEVWRTGANESTEITLYKDMTVGGKTIKAGTYTLFTIPGEKEWTVILNKDVNTWGAFGYKEERDIARITAPARKTSATIQDFSITFQPAANGADMLIGWDSTYVKIPFTTAPVPAEKS